MGNVTRTPSGTRYRRFGVHFVPVEGQERQRRLLRVRVNGQTVGRTDAEARAAAVNPAR